jgi:transmembrane sensor
MGNKRKYIVTGSEDDSASGFPGIDLSYRTTKEEAWAELSTRIDSTVLQPRQKHTLYYQFALAASILLILGMTAFLRFHTITTSCPAGKHLAVSLPEGSQVELNALSAITYHPYWMKFSRSVELEGEAYFKVKSGTSFKVISKRGETIVLGTSFNIYSRGLDYNVSCFTGAVKVVSLLNRESVIVYPSQQAFIQTDGSIRLVESKNIDAGKAWTRGMFIFTGAPLKSVIEEIERQYNIKITTREDYHLTYTGNFSKSISEKEVLDLVCTSLELKFEAKSNGEYLIYKNRR